MTEQPAQSVSPCSLCDVPRATDDCPHVEVDGERVTMALAEWHRLTDELTRLRNLEAELVDAGD